jgi:glucose-1-phosphate thymidylyltransferase
VDGASVELDADQHVVSFVEKPRAPSSDLGALPVYIYQRATLPLFSEFMANSNDGDSPGRFVEWLHARKPIAAYRVFGEERRCFDLGTPTAYREMCARIAPGIR